MEEVSTFIWGLSIALNILIVLIGLPLCLLICCCCRKSSAIKKDVASIMANHNLLNENQTPQQQYYMDSQTQQPQIPSNQNVVQRNLLRE